MIIIISLQLALNVHTLDVALARGIEELDQVLGLVGAHVKDGLQAKFEVTSADLLGGLFGLRLVRLEHGQNFSGLELESVAHLGERFLRDGGVATAERFVLEVHAE